MCVTVLGAGARAELLAARHAEPPAGNRAPGWTFTADPLTDVWFGGLARVGYFGFGPFPLYDPAFGKSPGEAFHAAGADGRGTGAPDLLAPAAASLLAAFSADDAFEVLHFVPLYFAGAGVEETLAALQEPDPSRPGGAPGTSVAGSPRHRFGMSAVAAVLTAPAERAVLARFARLLLDEWSRGGAAVWRARSVARAEAVHRAAERWRTTYREPLAGFLEREGLEEGTVFLTPALGAEGRFLRRDPLLPERSVVAVGLASANPDDVEGALGSLVRELCYPAVRRVVGPVEASLPDRVRASRVSDLLATWCGDRLLAAFVPAAVGAYRTRFGLSEGGPDRTFWSAAGLGAGGAALGTRLEDALLRALQLDREGRPDAADLHGRQE